MFSQNIQNYINESGQAAAMARVKQLSGYVNNLGVNQANQLPQGVKPFAEVLKTSAQENKNIFEIDAPPALVSQEVKAVPTFGSITNHFPATKEQILSIIEKTAEKYGVDEKLVKALVKQESGFNPEAKSKAGALGLMQLMPSTAKALGVNDPLNIAQNVDGGVRYLKSMLERFRGNKILALAAYNAGPNAVEKYGNVPPYPETQNYVKSILKNYL